MGVIGAILWVLFCIFIAGGVICWILDMFVIRIFFERNSKRWYDRFIS